MILTTHKTSKIRFPEATVMLELEGPGGNAIAIMADVGQALRKVGATDAEIRQFLGEAMTGNYENLLAVCKRWVTVL